MSKAIVIYETTFGNTRLAAEKMAEAMERLAGFQTDVVQVKKLNFGRLSDYDVILIGCPTHMGGPTRDTRNLAGKLGDFNLDGKTVAFFNCWSVPDCEGKPVQKLEEMAAQKAPGMNLVTPGLSIRVTGMKGPISEGEIRKCVEFATKVADRVKERAIA